MPAAIVVYMDCTSEAHDELKKSDAWWEAQENKGVQKIDGRPFLVLRNCRKCGSTLAKRVDQDNAPDLAEVHA